MSWLRFAIVGSGPAGFFTAKNLVKHFPEASIDMYERLPTPFGLIRYGVAPDHPEIKRVLQDFTRLAESSNFRFLGNVTIGRDLSHKTLARCYSAIIYAYGAASDSKLGIPGEERIVSARKFVEWYNGHPEADSFALSHIKSVSIIGNGNVAIDVIRVLGAPLSRLEHTDISSVAFEELKRSSVRDIHVIGRRGLVQAACTAKELRQLSTIQGMSHSILPDDFQASMNHSSRMECDLDQPSGTTVQTRARRRIFEIFSKFPHEPDQNARVRVHWHFLKSPVKVEGNELLLQRTELTGQPHRQSAKLTDQFCPLSSDLIFKSIGYRSVPIDPDVPFDHVNGVVQNRGCRVDAPGPALSYVTGWARTGPFGVLDTTMRSVFVRDMQLMMDSLLEDHSEKRLYVPEENVEAHLRTLRILGFHGWKKIDSLELNHGEARGKVRDKVLDWNTMLEVGGD